MGVVVLVILVKSVLAAITPLSGDFINLAYGAASAPQMGWIGGPYTFSIDLLHQFYELWLLIPVSHQWVYSRYTFIPSPSAFLLIFILKLPLLISDVLTAVLIHRIVLLLGLRLQIARFALLLWLLNPFMTLAIEMDGTMDIMSTFLVLLACYTFVRGRYAITGICLAVATLARFYPIVLFPFFVFSLAKQGKARDLCATVSSYFIPLILALIPFVAIFGMGFLNAVYSLPAGGNREFIWFLGFAPSSASSSMTKASSVMTVWTILALLMVRVWKAHKQLVLDAILIALLVFVGFSHFNRYYTIWVLPFFTINLATNWNSLHRKAYTILFTLFFASLFMYNFAYWWSTSLFFIYEFTPMMSELASLMRMVGSNLILGDLGTTFSQSLLSGACITYSILITLRNTIGAETPASLLGLNSYQTGTPRLDGCREPS